MDTPPMADDWLEALERAAAEIPNLQERVAKQAKDPTRADAMMEALVVAEHCIHGERRRLDTEVERLADLMGDLLDAVPDEERPAMWRRLRALLKVPEPILRGVAAALGVETGGDK